MSADVSLIVQRARRAQAAWAPLAVQRRVRVLGGFRHALAEAGEDLAATVPFDAAGSLHRDLADTLVAEVLPLAEACRFLEREAAWILAPRRAGNGNQPFWLGGVSTEIRREPFGVILIIGPGNYPLFLPGTQALQALAAGNAVLWKPAPGGAAAAKACRLLLVAAGLDPSLLQVLDEAPSSGMDAVRAGVDKVVLTGSESTGRTVMHALAETLTPSTMELSGCDAVYVLPGANLRRAVTALTFGLRLNGSATCMAPRRVFIAKAIAESFSRELVAALGSIGPVVVPEQTSSLLQELMFDAESRGARFALNGFAAATHVEGGGTRLYPTLVLGATAEMRITQTDIFAPVLSIIVVDDEEQALQANDRCPYALTAAIFGPSRAARRLASRIPAGSVLINDVIVSTADPRAPFGGRKRSGFGVTRGREGLLEMTTIKTVQVQAARDLRAYAAPTSHHAAFIAGYLRMAHARGLRARLAGAREFFRAMMKIK